MILQILLLCLRTTAIPQIEESCSGMKSATIPISESIITVIITTNMRIKSFLLSNFETRGNIVETIYQGLFPQVITNNILVVSNKCETLLTLDELHIKRNNDLSSLREGSSSHNNICQACKKNIYIKVNVGSEHLSPKNRYLIEIETELDNVDFYENGSLYQVMDWSSRYCTFLRLL